MADLDFSDDEQQHEGNGVEQGEQDHDEDGMEEDSSQRGGGGGGTLFSCSMDNAKVVTATLICLSNGTKQDGQYAQVEVNEDGLVFIVTGRAKCSQSQGTINSNLFQGYQCAPGGGRFTIDLQILLECLQIFGTSNLSQTVLTMAYDEGSAVLRLTLEEQGVLTTCEINAMEENEDALDLAALATAFRGSHEVFRAILKSELLKEAIAELSELPGASTIRVRVSPESPYFHLSAAGHHGRLEIAFSKHSEAFIHFACSEEREWAYKLPSLSQGMRALNVAKETYVRINEEGIMCVQHQVGEPSTFVDFLMMAEVEEEYEEDQQGNSQGQTQGGGSSQDEEGRTGG